MQTRMAQSFAQLRSITPQYSANVQGTVDHDAAAALVIDLGRATAAAAPFRGPGSSAGAPGESTVARAGGQAEAR